MTGTLPEQIETQLTQAEIEYFKTYKQILAKYSEQATKSSMDITTSMTPPKELFVEVRVLEDLGEIMLESGNNVLLTKDTVMTLKWSDAERLI